MYSNDRKAPRMKKAEFSINVVDRKLWRQFKQKHRNISWEEFYQLWQDIAETIREEAIFNPLGVKLGQFMGELKFQYLPHNPKMTDLGTSQLIGEEVNYVNLVTKGKTGKVKWERRWAVKFNRMLQFYAFEPTREIILMAKKRADEDPDSIRVARNTLGGFSIWRKLKNYGK